MAAQELEAEEVEPPLDVADLAAAAAHSLAWHGEQSRKGSGVPYVSHLLQVAGMVLEHGGDLVQAAAGLLHDCLEDAPSSAERAAREVVIREQFGRGTLELVLACTDTRPEESIGDKAPWRLRKQRLLEQLDVADYAVLYTSGGRTWGVVEREQDTVRTKEKETFSGMFIDVRYQTADGQEMIAQTPISYELARIVEVGDRIEVMYSLSDPQRYRLPAKFDLLGVVIDFAIMGFLAVFGIRGLRRNLDLGDLDSRERWSDA